MPADAASVVERLRADRDLGPQLLESLYLPAEPERFGDLERPLPAPLARALAAAGVERLWSHQAEGLDTVRSGRDLLITTPTASGKSLVFQLPVLEEALAGGPGRALFLYPLKALGQDQKTKLEALAARAGVAGTAVAIYDGDTDAQTRAEIKRDFPRVVISNPDMLHLGILGNWQRWEPFLRDLRWVVLDELHTYRGIFGSHFHHVLQRLTRVARAAGAEPRLIASSATAANAAEFADRLAARSFHWVERSGAPREGRHFLLFRPATSAYTLALQLLVHLLGAGLKTIVFTKARRITELLYSWLRQQEPALAARVASYRAGFLAAERRRIEADLFGGRLDGVIATSALEMGIDVGGLDACVLVGFPGSVMATWQRSGRVGRAGRESVTALVALPDALDQYLLDHPRELLERPCERLIVDPANEPVSRAHLVCAAAELPLDRERDRAYLEPLAPVVGDMLHRRDLVEAGATGEIRALARRPQGEVGLRSSGGTFSIVDGRGRVIGTVDGARAFHECHPGAIYLHWGRQFLVRQLDLDGRKAHVERVSVNYFTTPLTEKETDILEVLDRRREGALEAFVGRLRVTERVVGYERKEIYGQQPIDQHLLDLPPTSFETVGLWWAAPRELEDELRAAELHFMGALHAAEHAAISLLPLFTLADRGDIGGISLPLHPQLGCGAVFIYDGHAGGVGIAERGFAELPALLARVRELLEGCACDDGCPSCVQSPKCGNGNRPLDKLGAARFVARLLERGGGALAIAPVAVAPPPPPRQAEIPAPAEPARPEPPAAAPVPPPAAAAPAAGPADTAEEPRPPRVATAVAPAGEAGAAAREAEAPTEAEHQPPLPLAPLIPIPSHPRRTMLFDLETRRSALDVGGWANMHKMRLAVGVVCHLQEGRFHVFEEGAVGELVSLLESADAVVGYNILHFDYAVLAGYTGIEYRRKWPTLDLFADIYGRLGFRLGMNALAVESLGVEKSADGLESLEWVRAGRLDLVTDYCRRDVEILRDLYLYGRRTGYVLYRDKDGRQLRLPVDW